MTIEKTTEKNIKTCPSCKQTKELSGFHKGCSHCKECRAVKSAAYYKAHQDELVAKSAAHRKTVKERIQAYRLAKFKAQQSVVPAIAPDVRKERKAFRRLI